jgi:prophage regulatory protein
MTVKLGTAGMEPMARLPKLAGLAEVASLAGVSRTRAGQLAAHPDFPPPAQRLAMGPVWVEADVQAFLDTERKPGRKPKDGGQLEAMRKASDAELCRRNLAGDMQD